LHLTLALEKLRLFAGEQTTLGALVDDELEVHQPRYSNADLVHDGKGLRDVLSARDLHYREFSPRDRLVEARDEMSLWVPLSNEDAVTEKPVSGISQIQERDESLVLLQMGRSKHLFCDGHHPDLTRLRRLTDGVGSGHCVWLDHAGGMCGKNHVVALLGWIVQRSADLFDTLRV
jgi:hypothetical protein